MRNEERNKNTPLIIIDFQKAIDDPSWGDRNNHCAEANIELLLKKWRQKKRPIFHVKHDSLDPNSTYRPGQIGNDFKVEAKPFENERVITKTTNSAFIGTDLELILRSSGQQKIVIAGVITNNSIEATVRNAGNLGFETYLVENACFTFGKKDWNGKFQSAEDIHAMSLANLHQEYCSVIPTCEALEF